MSIPINPSPRIERPAPASAESPPPAGLAVASPSPVGGDVLEVRPQQGGRLRIRLGAGDASLETTRHVPAGRTTLHVGPGAGLIEPTVRGPEALRIMEQRTVRTNGRRDAPLSTVADGVLPPGDAPRGADSTVIVQASRPTDAVISGRVPVSGTVIVRLMPGGPGEGDKLAYTAQSYVQLKNDGQGGLRDIKVDLLTLQSSLASAQAEGPEALMAMLSGGAARRDAAMPKGTYVCYRSLDEPVSLGAGESLILPLGDPVELSLQADVDAEVRGVRPTLDQDAARVLDVSAFAAVSIDKAGATLPPALYEILHSDGHVLSAKTLGAINAKESAELGRIPFDTIKGKCSLAVNVTNKEENRADVVVTAVLTNDERTSRAVNVLFDLWNINNFQIKDVLINGKKTNPKIKVNPKMGYIFVPVDVTAASDAGPGTAAVQLTLGGTVVNPKEGIPASQLRDGADSRPTPTGLYA